MTKVCLEGASDWKIPVLASAKLPQESHLNLGALDGMSEQTLQMEIGSLVLQQIQLREPLQLPKASEHVGFTGTRNSFRELPRATVRD